MQCSKLNYNFFYKSTFGELKLQKLLPDESVGQHYTVQESKIKIIKKNDQILKWMRHLKD